MPGASELAVFVAASLLLAVTPGPDLIYVIARGAAQGQRAGVVAAAGLCTGIMGHTLFCVVGLSAVIAASATTFAMIKYAGAAYLVYLAVRMWRGGDGMEPATDPRTVSLRAIFRQSVIMNLLNPKVALFFLAFLPQFIDPQGGAPAAQFALLGAIFMVSGFLVMGAAGLAAGQLNQLLSTRSGASRSLRWGAGAIFLGIAYRLAFSGGR